ncbi:alpha-galactosidase [Spirosoma profusum]|uniref:alpha-galactosidase n=1 Tax=Spirosoma profusum TaxID=2771354 RepID=UPI001CC26F9F|nr:alpha-galactosidase [Spirosoma profusum]
MNTFYRAVAPFVLLSIRCVAQITIPVETTDFAVVLQSDKDNYLHMVYCGKKLNQSVDYKDIISTYRFPSGNSGVYSNAYTPAGTWNLAEPAIQVTHSDGNPSLDLKYVSHQTVKPDANSTLTTVQLADPVYKLNVSLFYKTWQLENVIEQWSEITNQEKGPVVLQKYASANLFFPNNTFYLTSFQGQYLKEMQPTEEKLQQGIRTIDSKLGTRAMLLGTPNFIVSFDQPAQENSGTVLLGQLAWSGNYKLDFEIDSYKTLRLIAGINPYASAYTLPAGKSFRTPSLIYTISGNGTGQASRQLQRWARNYRVLDGKGDRLTLLNNWEATYFDFDETKLSGLITDTKKLGADMFLLDDGWFGNKYPRNNDDAGLGDWQENVKKLPHGIGYLVKAAKETGVKFGIWIEPEMVNPKSELYEKHPDWVIRQPERPEKYYRNQLVLDLANPQVQDFVFGVVDGLFTKNPELAFIKWDCNAVIYNAYSVWLSKNKLPQTHLYVEYVRGLYAVLERIRAKHPKVPMMLCSGGGGRGDYELLKYFTEFWPSDDTEPIERIFQQWNYSYFFPSITTDCHVTDWGKQPIKFRVDVASMGKLGFDIVVNHLKPTELEFCQQALKNYSEFKTTVWHGEQYRLASPYENPFASLMYVSANKANAVMFSYFHSSSPIFTLIK